jgi:acetyl-CoA carboxylase beta subunit
MTTFDAYIKCPQCGGQGWWTRNEKIGSNIIKTPVHCDKCNGHGEILASKLRLRPLFDARGQPIDQDGKILKRPDQEPYSRRLRRKQYMEEMYGPGK